MPISNPIEIRGLRNYNRYYNSSIYEPKLPSVRAVVLGIYHKPDAALSEAENAISNHFWQSISKDLVQYYE